MSEALIPMDGGKAIAFHSAFEKRDNYIASEGINLLIDGEASVPLPGCPACGRGADRVVWLVQEETITIVVGACGHRFLVQRPVIATTETEFEHRTEEWIP